MEQRRTVLAFALIFVVIIAFQFIDAQMRPDPQPVDDAATEMDSSVERPVEVATNDPISTQPVTREPAEASQPSGDAEQPLGTIEAAITPVASEGIEQTVTVTTPRYEMTISGRGARISGWRGLSYSNGDGEPVEIIPQGDEAVPYGMDAVVFNAADLELGRLLFSTDAPARLAVNEGSRSVTFAMRTRGDLEIRKTYTFSADSYDIELDLEVAAVGPQAASARSLLGTPRQLRFGWPQGIASTEGDDRLEKQAFRSFAKVEDELEIKKRGEEIKDVDKVRGTYSGRVNFVGLQNKYFTIIGLPGQGDQAQDGTVILSGDEDRNLQTWSVELPLTTGDPGTDAYALGRIALYLGPQETDILKAYGIGLDKTMDLGWALFRPLTEATLWIMHQLRRFIPNWGVIIIIFSVLTKLAFYPLTKSSTESMKRMQQLQPKVKEIQEKYKDNQEKQSKAMMELYQKEKVNPMAGCLPLLLQMPVFIALYQALAHTIALRNTPFFGWIDDLSKPDALFALPFSLPFLGSDFNLLPLVMTAATMLQTRLTPQANTGPQMALMNTMMPVMFLFIFYQMPSGLVLYWLVNSLMTIYQTWRIHKTATPVGGQETA